jgi:sugar/nucleoside kinase (ribokinase family)
MDRHGVAQQVPARRAAVVDATGAGDCFAAGLIAGLWHGWSMVDAVRLGHASGAACVAAVGATAGVGSWAEMVGRL